MPFGKTQDSVSLLVTQQITHKDTISKEQDVQPLVHLKPSTADEQKVLTKLPQATDAQQAQLFGQSSLKNLPLAGPNYFSKNSSKAETQKITEIRSGPASSETATSVSNLANGKDLERSIDLHNSTVAINSSGLQGAPSQSWSGAKVIFSGSSESRSPFLPSTLIQGNKSDNTHISADTGSVPVDLAGKRFYLKDTIGGSPSTNFSVRPTQIVGQKAIMKTETIDSLPSIRNAHLTSQETFALGRSANQRPYSSKDAHKVPSLLNTEPHLSRQFGNIKEMAKELDILLECIEGPGGFQDATLSHKHSVEALEERMQTLSKKCRMWKNMMDDQLGEIEHLLDKTVQVLARKIYMEGIVKQASDSCYWELWNRQKLSSELELKRRHILKLNQVLTNQLIELERHFNNLELHKFGENGGVLTGRRVSQSRHGSSRQIQSLHSLYNTTNSQLAAAEQLSESLSRQMAVLSVESPIKTRNVKKELFETIGIPYEPNFCSPDATSIGDSPSLKKNLLSPGSAATRRRQSSAMKSSDSETARRRRDSLGQSWASFEPSKTTVKRVLLQESEKTSLNKLSFMDRQHLGPSVLDSSSAVSHPTNLTSPSTFMYPSGNKGTQYVFPKQAFDSGTAPSKLLNNSLRPPMLQSDNALLPSISASQARPMTGQNLAKESSNITAHKSTGRVSSVGNSDSRLINENHSIQQSETSLLKKSSVSMELAAETPALTKKPSEILSYNMKGTVDTSSMTETLNHVPTSTKGFDTSFSLLNTADVPSHPGKVVQFNAAASKTQPSEKTPLSQAFSTSLSVSSMSLSFSSPVMTPSASIAPAASSSSSTTSLSNATPIGKPFVSSKDNIDANQKVSLTSQSSVSSVFPSGSLSFQASKSLSPLHTAAPVSESYKMELRSGTGKISPPVNPTHSPSVSESLKTEVQLPTSDTSLSIIPAPPPPTSESPKPGLQSPAEKTSPSANQTSPLTLESLKTQLQPSKDKLSSRTEVDTGKAAPLAQPEPPAFSLKLDPPVSSARTTEMVTQLESGSQSSLNMAGAAYSIPQNVQPKQPSDVQNLFGAALASDSATSGKNANLEITVTEEDEMEEEAPETSCINEISLGGIGGLGLGSNPSSTAARTNPFGVSFGSNIGTTGASSSFTMTVPSGELFRPASFNFSNFSPQPSQPSPPANLGAFSGGFGATATSQAPAPRGFGQPSQIGAGQAALGSVLGSFGQSRQIGSGFPGGFASTSSMGGLSSAATGGGFAHVAPTGGGFAGLASGGGGFANLASGGGGFAGMASTGGGFGGLGSAGGGFPAAAPGGGGGGFAGAASSGGGGFGAFNSQQQGAGGFSAFGGNAGATGKPPELFTQMRK
ncbi:hypothetical protein JCGZ_16196 [Jatropha curcas]|uniref:Nuclear pore complex protein NUP214 n=1 Tax=Jatropha curcas TaxID=180498 RepID=A0A067K335_JATCU|nr:hypothetical protein JCGZ_16196 [Jatropha curcas]